MNQQDINKAIADAVAKAMKPPKVKKTKGNGGGRQKLTDAQRAEFQAANDAECIKVFTAAGFKDVKPRENVLTYKKWVEKGRKVMPGQKAHRVNGFPLFHIDQTEELPANTVAA